MSFWKWLLGSPDHNTATHEASHSSTSSAGAVNPATGLPMVSGDMSGIDVGGSFYGTDAHSGSSWHSESSCEGGSGGMD
jgi:hypothetical protein